MEGCILDNNTCVPFEAGSCAPCCEQLGGNSSSSSSSADGSGGSGSGGAEAQLEDCTWEDWFNDGEHSSPRRLSIMPFRLRSGVCLWAGRCGPCVVLSIGSLIFTGWGVLCVWLPTFCRLRNL